MKLIPIISALILAAGSVATAQAPAMTHAVSSEENSPKYIRSYLEILDKGDVLGTSSWGVVAVRADGDTIVSFNGKRKLVPASNVKLLTTGLALNELGPDFRFRTTLAYSGKIEGGALKGDLYIVGGGDPTLGSKDSIAIATETLFSSWKSMLAKAGINRIDGRIIGDGRFFDGPIEKDSWSYQDIGTYYGAGGDALCFYRNVLDIRVSAGTAVGEPVNVVPEYPELPWMEYSNVARTSAKGTGDKLFLFNTDLAPVAQMRGTFAIDRKPKKEECSNKFGAMTMAMYFCNYLKWRGLPVSGGYADIDYAGNVRSFISKAGDTAVASDSLSVIGHAESPSLKRIAYMTNWRSDNFYAETMLRMISRTRKGSADYAVCKLAETEAFRRLGLDASAVQLTDGSGLSRDNFVSPEFFCSFLRKMMDTKVFGDYVETLAQPGYRYYEPRLKGEPETLRSRIRYKSGSMDGVRCFSGYVIPSEGSKEDTIVFSVMINNCTAPSWKVLPLMDKIIALIAACN